MLPSETHTLRQADQQTNRQTDMQADRQAGRQTDTFADMDTELSLVEGLCLHSSSQVCAEASPLQLPLQDSSPHRSNTTSSSEPR